MPLRMQKNLLMLSFAKNRSYVKKNNAKFVFAFFSFFGRFSKLRKRIYLGGRRHVYSIFILFNSLNQNQTSSLLYWYNRLPPYNKVSDFIKILMFKFQLFKNWKPLLQGLTLQHEGVSHPPARGKNNKKILSLKK